MLKLQFKTPRDCRRTPQRAFKNLKIQGQISVRCLHVLYVISNSVLQKKVLKMIAKSKMSN